MEAKRARNRTISIFLIAALLCMLLAGCGGAQDQQLQQQISDAITQSKAALNEVMSLADTLSGESSILMDAAEEGDSLDVMQTYAALCRTSLESLEEKIGAVRQQAQAIARCDAPQSERGQEIYAAQETYFSDAMTVLTGMQQALQFYLAQYDAVQPLLDTMTQSAQSAENEQQYLIAVYEKTHEVQTELEQLQPPAWLSTLWPLYVSSMDILTKYMESRSWGLAYSDVLRLYSASQLITRMGIVSSQREETMFDLFSREYNHAAFLIDSNLNVLGDEIVAACQGAALPQDGYLQQAPIVFSNVSTVQEIYPNLYPSMDSAINLLLYTDKGYCDVMVTAEITGFTQTYEQKLTLSPEMTYLMIKPPVLSELPDLSSAKQTQLTLRVEDVATGEAIVQQSENISLYSIYDYKNYSDAFGIIQNDNILAWMTPESEGTLQVRRQAITWLEQNFGPDYGMLPGYQPAYGFGSGQEANITYYQVAAIQSAISDLGVRYNMGPYSFSASQRVLMPDAVLANQSGICIETAVLMASVLESAGMHAMIVFTPGHAQTAVETWSGSGEYFLIETTMLPFTATEQSLNSLIQPLSAAQWAEYLETSQQKAQESGGMVYIVDCDLAPVLNIRGLS